LPGNWRRYYQTDSAATSHPLSANRSYIDMSVIFPTLNGSGESGHTILAQSALDRVADFVDMRGANTLKRRPTSAAAEP
jgi:hypothetical protein